MTRNTNRQAQARFDLQTRHRINAGRVAVRDQIAFFDRQFGQVASEWKEDDTRVTFADFAISEKIFAELRRDFPEDDYCSEEASPQDEELQLDAMFAWVVDPIDGTNNFALGFPVCAISLALLHYGTPIYGFIYDHSTGALLEGGPGRGLQRDLKKLNRNDLAAEAQSMVGLHFPIAQERLQQIGPLLENYRVRCLGSGALTAAYVATGYLSGVFDDRVKVWDIAAAFALCAAVGIEFTFIKETPFPMRTFHPSMTFSPYYAGTQTFRAEMAKLI
ncbi:MAG TPA: inositol monophosphatase [Opitutae bacterium]|nr:inositol monophosphatase [Opitutae bacterium]